MNETEFEFNENYLVYLAFHAYTNKFFELTHLNPYQYLNGG